MNLTEKIIEEFEGKFVELQPDNSDWGLSLMIRKEAPEKLKLFLLSSLKQIATEAIEAVRLEKNFSNNSNYGYGYNQALGDMEQKAKKFLDENFGEKKD